MLAATRILVAIVGLLSLISVYQHWFDVTSLADARGITTIGAIGNANIRAGIGGLFLAIAVFAFVAAWKRSTTWLAATWLLPALALLGRLVSLALDGGSSRVFEPIVVEAVVLTLLGSVYLYWRKLPEGL